MLAAHAPKSFRSILACELDPVNSGALTTRLRNVCAPSQFHVATGDCNEAIEELTVRIPKGALTLAFIDPEGLHIQFETIERLSKCGRVDLLILLADRMDIVRNVDLYFQQANSNLDRMFGPGSRWRDSWSSLMNRTPANICDLFISEYQNQLKRLGYLAFDDKEMKSARGPLYRLIFASKHERGLEFWNKITRLDRRGQQEMF